MGDDNPRKRYPKNAPGPFFVEDQLCISCGVPESEAPDLMSDDGNSCYFRKQPSTPEELERAIQAVDICCCGAVQYDGDDPDILLRLAELEEESRQSAMGSDRSYILRILAGLESRTVPRTRRPWWKFW